MSVVIEPVIPKYPRGHVETVDTWQRDIAIVVMIDLTVKGTGLCATRSRATSAPSVAYFVAEMLRRKGVKLKEQQLNRIWGEHELLAGRLEAAMPASAF